jgi:deoxyribodipyrimidine photolyase-related protein
VTTLRLILGDQLTRDVSSLCDLDPAADVVLLVEVADETTYVRHHKQKIALILSAMRHFAEELRDEGVTVDYVRLEQAGNTGSFDGELRRAVARHRPGRIVVTEPGEWRVWEAMRLWSKAFDIPVEIREDDRFFCSRRRFARWARDRKSYRMEFFYRDMRRETGLLMDGEVPVGGRWNFDAENRKSLPPGLVPPPRAAFEPDAITREVLDLVAGHFPDHFGDLEPFGWGVKRENALEALDHFMAACLPSYGDYQDAMKSGNAFLYHSVLSPYLNCGLLTAREVCFAAEREWKAGRAPLNAVEGFIRQILGWREYVRGIYWLRMPDYAKTNALSAKRPLPWFYWSGETAMNCVANAIGDTRRHAYANHIQRLMVTGNFALLAGIDPAEIEEWYLVAYADAYEWVELPNVHGMVMFADGGLLASKPYAASGAYIDRMSDYCSGCAYDPAVKTGPGACPFNVLYWNFLIENRAALGKNPRMAMPYRTLDRMAPERRKAIVKEAAAFLAGLAGDTGAQGGGRAQLALDLDAPPPRGAARP